MGTLRPLALPEGCLAFLFFVSPVERKTMKAMTFDKSFAEKKDTFANLIANLSRMVLTTSERLFYIKLLTRGFRSTPMYHMVLQNGGNRATNLYRYLLTIPFKINSGILRSQLCPIIYFHTTGHT